MGFRRSFRPKNELVYNQNTYIEWALLGSGTTKSSAGIHLVADGSADMATLSVNCKPSTKYGLLYGVIDTDLNDTIAMAGGYLTASAVYLTKAVGKNKVVFTTSASININSLTIVCTSSNTNGKYIDLDGLRLFELSSGSEIEADFTNLTNDQLDIKYPWFYDRTALSINRTGGLK